MSGRPRWASWAPSLSSISEWTIDCGWTTTSIRVVADAEQVVGLDHLEALVHQGRRVDRDPARPSPRSGARAPRPGSPRRGRSRPRNGPPEAVSISRSTVAGALGAQELEQRRVLGVDRQDPGLGRLGQRRDQLAADDEALLVGEREVDPLGERDDRRPEPGDADDRVQDEVGLGGE